MGSPANLLQGLGYTVAELQAMGRSLFSTGQPASVSGGGKSMSFDNLPPDQKLIEIRAELNRLQGKPTPRRVEQILIP